VSLRLCVKKSHFIRGASIFRFSTNPAASAGGKKPLTEDAAKAKASKLLADLRAGADFIKAVKEYSEDETSRAKDGDFQTLRPSDNIPDSIKSAVFALKPGELTDVVRQPSGFYIFRAEEVSSQPLAEVRGEILAFLKQKRSTDWMAQANRDTKVTYTARLSSVRPGSGQIAA
jgi:parvulin-like peptidyl-prolyl isomerase